MKPKVYIETSIPSYLTAWHSRDLIVAANQEITKQWWDSREQFDLYISALVIQGCFAYRCSGIERYELPSYLELYPYCKCHFTS